MCKNIENIKNNYLGAAIKSADVNAVCDLTVRLQNSLQIHVPICYRGKSALHYALYKGKEKIGDVESHEETEYQNISRDRKPEKSG